ncbi:DUF4007 family protein [Phaeodactylibacter luteus]|uniref:DUF4007 family protein n=1 Tax=Phaeodactylibacter luteus TaxID=1564516 RepID=A0A5C6RFW8_9BACT|nr:DUF4007 family protein [Phaeodactylibacter luteus]TXB60610.1 DUF4007 family protein [Phaeodactylibacter luteus]
MEAMYFTGHETFHCRNYWLKKGLDLLWGGKRFDEEAVVELGVGKNMVSAIRFWLKAFDLLDADEKPNSFAELLFRDGSGLDPYLEDPASLWLLHYRLVTAKRSSIYHFVFNFFRKQRIEFREEHLRAYLERQVEESGQFIHSSSIRKDISVFLRNYLPPNPSKGIEEGFSRMLYELELIEQIGKEAEASKGKDRRFKIENKVRRDLPYQVLLYCIVENPNYSTSINFKQLSSDVDSVGSVFALSDAGLLGKIEELIQDYPKHAVFTDDGGVRVLQFRKPIDHKGVLKLYYDK